MASTSGLYNTVTCTRDEIILDALQDCRAVMDGQGLSAGDKNDAARKLNMLLKRWQTKALLLWCRDTIQVPMQANKRSYTIGPSGDVDTYRPLRVLEGTYLRLSSGTDAQLRILPRKEYQMLGSKSSTGTPNSVYYDPQMGSGAYNPATANGVLYVYVTPFDASGTIYLEVQRPIQDMTNSNQAFDLPAEWYHALTKNLAAELADKYEVPEQRVIRLKLEAKEALEEILDWGAQEWVPVTFQPEIN